MTSLACPETHLPVDEDTTGDDDDATGDDDATDDDSAADDDMEDDDVEPGLDEDGDGWSLQDGDCDDSDPLVYPGAAETACDGVDSDCDGLGEDVVAAIAGQEYLSISDALLAVPAGGTVQVCPGIHQGQVWISEGQELTLTSFSGDPEDTLLDGQGIQTVVYIGSGAEVVVSNLTIQNGLGEPWLSGAHAGGGMMTFGKSTEVSGCVFVDNHVSGSDGQGGAIKLRAGRDDFIMGELIVHDCRFEANGVLMEAGHGGAISCDSVDDAAVVLNISEATFLGNEAAGDGGAIEADGAPLTASITNSDFTDNRCDGDGGAIFILHWDVLEVERCTFLGNEADNAGGAISLSLQEASPATVSIVDTTFEENHIQVAGGAIALAGESGRFVDLCIDGSTFTANTSEYLGGGLHVYLEGRHAITVTDTDFVSNTGAFAGGGITLDVDDQVLFEMVGGSLIGNQTDNAGAAIMLLGTYAEPGSTEVTLDSVTVEGNVNNHMDWAAVFCGDNSICTLDSCTIHSNDGGGAYLMHGPGATLTSVNSDWGTAATDNDPYDIELLDVGAFDSYGAGANFTCAGGQGCS